jgi:hypothetical protein
MSRRSLSRGPGGRGERQGLKVRAVLAMTDVAAAITQKRLETEFVPYLKGLAAEISCRAEAPLACDGPSGGSDPRARSVRTEQMRTVKRALHL